MDLLLETFLGKLTLASTYLQQTGVVEANESLSRPLNRTMGFWAFCRPDLRNMHHLAGLALGEDPDASLVANHDHRKAKAQTMKQLSTHWKELERKIAYRLDADQAKMLEPAVIAAIAQLENQVDWLTSK